MGVVVHTLGVEATLLLLLLRSVLPQTDYAEHVISACFNQTDKFLTANCTAGHMVILRDVFFGHSAHGRCAYTEGDCTMADHETHPCVGKSICELNLPSGNLGRQIPTCQKYSTYMQIAYTCVPEEDIIDICEVDQISMERGYIITPRYPKNYPASQECHLQIQAHSSQQIVLHAIDFDLGTSSGSRCADTLYIEGVLKTKTVCGHRRPQEIFRTKESSLRLTFLSDTEGSNKGFWLHYQAYPPKPLVTTDEATTSLATTLIPWRHILPNLPPTRHIHGVSQSHVTQQSDSTHQQWLPVEAIVAAVIGTLVVILLVLLILLIIKRRKEREMLSSSLSTCYLHGKSIPGSSVHGTPGPYIQNNLDTSLDCVV